MNNLVHFCLLKMWVALPGLPDCSLLFRSKFPPLSLDFLTQQCTVLMSTVPLPCKANNHWSVLIPLPFSWVKNPITAHCLMRFDTPSNKSPILSQIQHKPLRFPSHIAWQTEAQETINRLQQVLIPGNNFCMTHLHQAITFCMSYTENKGKILLMH